MVDMLGRHYPTRYQTTLAQWLFGQLTNPHDQPLAGFIFPVGCPFCFAYIYGRGMVNAKPRPGHGWPFALHDATLGAGDCRHWPNSTE